jgi:hypothetical protein
MESIIYLLKLAVLDPWRSRGAAFCLLMLILVSILPGKVKASILRQSDLKFETVTPLVIFGIGIIALVYLAFPNYLDHAEATMASLGGVLFRGEILYPLGDLYPYHGMVYGPAPAEIQWTAREIGLPIVLGSKIPGVLSFLLSMAILLHLNRSSRARGYLLFMMPMGLILFWNRSEPFLLLLVSGALLASERYADSRLLPLALGMIGGAASAFKIHGILYVFAVYLLVHFSRRFSVESLMLFGAAAAAVFGLFYMAPGVSIWAFFDYVKIMGGQGLSLQVMIGNVFFLALMAAPVLISLREKGIQSLAPRQILVLGGVAGLEVLVAVIAGKPGAGVHHLLPFVAINAYMMGTLLDAREAKGGSIVSFIYASMLFPVVIAMLSVISPMVKYWTVYSEAKKEIFDLSKTYHGLVAGVAEMDQFPYVYYRVLLDGPQPDYTAFMDLQYSGISDDSFAARLKVCEIKNVVVPTGGAPFAMHNLYTGKPLMSDSVRTIFKDKYDLVRLGRYYNVYSCNRS